MMQDGLYTQNEAPAGPHCCDVSTLCERCQMVSRRLALPDGEGAGPQNLGYGPGTLAFWSSPWPLAD